MVTTCPDPVRPQGAEGRHAAEETETHPPSRRTTWRERLLPGHGDDAPVGPGHVVFHIGEPLDDVGAHQLDGVLGRHRLRPHQVVVVHLAGCEFVNLRGFRALLRFDAEVARSAGLLLVLDPPRSLQLICRSVPGRLTLASDPRGAAS